MILEGDIERSGGEDVPISGDFGITSPSDELQSNKILNQYSTPNNDEGTFHFMQNTIVALIIEIHNRFTGIGIFHTK